MGGIACYFQFDSSQNKAVLDDENLSKSLEYINHHGPDSIGIYFSACGRIGLGYVQLSVVGTDNGQQPLSNQESDIHVVVNGELYDYKRIKSKLQAKGYQFKTESDIKGALLVASEIKAFLPLGWQPEWDVDSLMNNGVMFDCRTVFKGVNKLPTAHYMVASSAGSIQIRPYWCQKYANKLIQDTRTVEAMIKGVQVHLVDAVKQRLEGNVAVGIYLDDNVNTCCIAGIVKQIRKETNSKEKIKAFSLAIAGGNELNENTIVKRTAELCDADLEILQVSEEGLLDKSEESIWYVEQPHLNLYGVGRFMLSKLVRDQGYKVMLTGDGADEHFAGHPHFIKDYPREAGSSVPDGFGSVSNDERAAPAQKMNTTENNIGRKHVTGSMLNGSTAPAFLETSITLARSFYSEEAIKKYSHRDPALTVAEALNGISRNNANNKCHPLHTAMSVQCTTVLANHVLSSFSDRSAMAHSVEVRIPFLDHQLCDYVNSLPPSVKIKAEKDGTLIDKWILREAVKPYVTTDVYEGINHQSYSALSSDSTFIKLLKKHLTKEKIERLGWINYNTAKAARESYCITKSHKTYQDLLVIMSYVVLSKQFNVATARFETVTFSKTKQVNSVEKQSSEPHRNTVVSILLKKIVMAVVAIAPMACSYYQQ